MSSKSAEDQYYEFALDCVKNAGAIVKEAFAQPTRGSNVMTKENDTDLVTETDQKVENLIVGKLRAAFPDHRFIGEETTSNGQKIVWTDAPTWIIDPIDGTTNFVHRIPHIAICVALSIGREIRAGIVYNPILEDLYTARKGRGAFKNGFPIRCSTTTALSKSVVAITYGRHNITLIDDWLDIAHANFRAILHRGGSRGIRSFGSCAVNMVFVAEGILDAYVEYGVHCWDMAASGIIVSEAGGQFVDPKGGAVDIMRRCLLVTGTKELAKELTDNLTHVEYATEAE